MAAMPASPQPVVFTISPGQQGTCTRPLWSAANTPSPPRLMNTRRRPVASRASAAALRLAASVMDTPESSSASSRLGLRQETDEYGKLQSYLCDTDPQTSLLRNAISNYSDTDEPDDPDEPTPPPSETALKITKYEAGTTVTLSGATFEVVGPDGDTIGVYTTPESGSITIPLTEVGNYTIYERVPPEYHLLDEELR